MGKVLDVLHSLCKRPAEAYVQAFENDEDRLRAAGIDTPLRQAHFLAQVLHETGGGTILHESLSYKNPDRLLEIFGFGKHSAAIRPEEVAGLLGNAPALAERVYGLGNPKKAQELGNTRPGDGYRYRGGGALQTTGGANYRRMGEKAGADFHADPELIVDPRYALKPAIETWVENALNQAADQNDIRTVTRKINGGYNGLKDRQDWFDKAYAAFSADAAPAWQAAQAAPDTLWLQQALNALGVRPRLVEDGRQGPATRQAVRDFQAATGLQADGIAGDVTVAMIRLRLETVRGG